MPRSTTKSDLITAAHEQFGKLWKLIDSMSLEKQNAIFGNEIAVAGKENHWERDKNLRDVLVHLYEWHKLLLKWVTANQKNEKKSFLPEPYTWKTYSDMNVEFWKKHQTTLLDDAKTMLQDSHKKILDLIELFSNDELFLKQYFSWTGKTNLGSYCISATSSHYDWALKKLKIHDKNG